VVARIKGFVKLGDQVVVVAAPFMLMEVRITIAIMLGVVKAILPEQFQRVCVILVGQILLNAILNVVHTLDAGYTLVVHLVDRPRRRGAYKG